MDGARTSASRSAPPDPLRCRASDPLAHDERQPNDGAADWLIEGTTALGVPFEAIYDHPSHGDETTARVISAWRVGEMNAPARGTLGLRMYAYYDADADIAWLPTGESDDVVSERVPGGLREYDRTTHYTRRDRGLGRQHTAPTHAA